VIVVAIVTIAVTATIGLLAALSKGSASGFNRGLAMMTAQNTLARARTAAAYFPLARSQAQSDAVAADAATQSKAYILNASSSFAATERFPASTCGVSGGAASTITRNVATTLVQNVFDVKVTYPHSACAQTGTETVEMSEVLPPASFIPGTRVYQPLAHEPTDQ